jgi:hypothetical protein
MPGIVGPSEGPPGEPKPVWDPKVPAPHQFYVDNPDRARALFRIRQQLSKDMDQIVRHPEKYNNADVMDWIRDRAKEYQLQFFVRKDPLNDKVIHLFVRDPIIEPVDVRAKPENPSWLGWVERNTKPTQETGG